MPGGVEAFLDGLLVNGTLTLTPVRESLRLRAHRSSPKAHRNTRSRTRDVPALPAHAVGSGHEPSRGKQDSPGRTSSGRQGTEARAAVCVDRGANTFPLVRRTLRDRRGDFSIHDLHGRSLPLFSREEADRRRQSPRSDRDRDLSALASGRDRHPETALDRSGRETRDHGVHSMRALGRRHREGLPDRPGQSGVLVIGRERDGGSGRHPAASSLGCIPLAPDRTREVPGAESHEAHCNPSRPR